jgi:hypothetical protein
MDQHDQKREEDGADDPDPDLLPEAAKRSRRGAKHESLFSDGSLPSEIQCMEVGSEDEERHVDSGQVMGEPPRQVDIRDRSAIGAGALGKLCERAARSVGHKDQAFARDYSGGDSGPAIRAPAESCIQDVHHARLDREPRQRVDHLDRRERRARIPPTPMAHAAASVRRRSADARAVFHSHLRSFFAVPLLRDNLVPVNDPGTCVVTGLWEAYQRTSCGLGIAMCFFYQPFMSDSTIGSGVLEPDLNLTAEQALAECHRHGLVIASRRELARRPGCSHAPKDPRPGRHA